MNQESYVYIELIVQCSSNADCPPPLSSLADQVQAVKQKDAPPAQRLTEDDDNLPMATLTLASDVIPLPQG